MTEWREYQRESMLLDHQNGVSEMAEHYKKVRCDVISGWCMLDACLTQSLRSMLWSSVFASTPALTSPQFLDLFRLTLVIDHE
jgi:hypothetical protein